MHIDGVAHSKDRRALGWKKMPAIDGVKRLCRVKLGPAGNMGVPACPKPPQRAQGLAAGTPLPCLGVYDRNKAPPATF